MRQRAHLVDAESDRHRIDPGSAWERVGSATMQRPGQPEAGLRILTGSHTEAWPFGATGIVAAPRLICWQCDSEMTAVEPVPPVAVTSLPARTARRPGLDAAGPPRCGKYPPGAPQ